MFKLVSILWNSFRMALQELRVNKLRTFLSLFGISIGIFCIIGVMTTIDSLQRQVQTNLRSLTSKVIWIDKWDYSDGGDSGFPWWKYVKRPTMKYEDMQFLKANTKNASYISYFLQSGITVDYKGSVLNGSSMVGVSNDYDKIQDFKIISGRYLSEADFERGTSSCVIGFTNAETLFGEAANAVGKEINIKGKKVTIIGLIEKQGNGPLNLDASTLVPYRFFASLFDPLKTGQNIIIAQAKEGVTIDALIDELRGNMRQLRRLSPKDPDNFALNDMNKIVGAEVGKTFKILNLAGWAIAGLSLIVGAFGVANIMFVTVRERTSQIGLKKAIGAKSRTILTEFLLESAFLCIIGGLIGLLFVWVLTLILSSVLDFPIFISLNIISMAMSICVVLGILSGIIPAAIAARMDPVVAIRS
jgi:putative ABC transport system permease protein